MATVESSLPNTSVQLACLKLLFHGGLSQLKIYWYIYYICTLHYIYTKGSQHTLLEDIANDLHIYIYLILYTLLHQDLHLGDFQHCDVAATQITNGPAHSGHLGCRWIVETRVGAMAPRAAKSKASKKGSEKSSSSGSPPPHSASPTVRERVGNYELVNLSKQWDDNEIIRDSVRENHNLLRTVREEGDRQVILDEYVEGNTENVKANREVLGPIMEIMGQHDKLIPNLDNLIQCVDAFYRKAKKTRTLEHCYQMAWAIRRLIQVVKSVCYRPAPPEDRRVYYKQGCDTFDEMVGYKYIHFNKCLIDKYFGWKVNLLLLVFWSKATCTNMHQSYITNLLMFGALVIPYMSHQGQRSSPGVVTQDEVFIALVTKLGMDVKVWHPWDMG